MLDQLYNQWLTYYYLPPETEKSLTPLLKPGFLILAFVKSNLKKSTKYVNALVNYRRWLFRSMPRLLAT